MYDENGNIITNNSNNKFRKDIYFMKKKIKQQNNNIRRLRKKVDKLENKLYSKNKESKTNNTNTTNNSKSGINNSNIIDMDNINIKNRIQDIIGKNSDAEIIVQIEPFDLPKGNMKTGNPFDKILDMIMNNNNKRLANIGKTQSSEKKNDKNNNSDDSDDEIEIDESIEVEELDIDIKSIDNLIDLGNMYVKLSNNKKKAHDILSNFNINKSEIDNIISNKDIEIVNKKTKINERKKNNGLYELNGKYYSINLETIYKLRKPLLKLKSMIGLENVKNAILDMILYYIQNFEKSNRNMLHTVIQGPPGVGKTELGKIIAEIYSCMGIISSNKFHIVKRTDLIGEYVGHTAHKTQRAIDEALGGVLFIDEAYSLGSTEGKDTFSKECIDTLNLNLSEQKKNLIVIIAGYPEELEKCFFSLNPGLNRRFPFRYHIQGYNEIELKDIFIKKVKDIKWNLYSDTEQKYIIEFFKNNLEKFDNYGGDIDNLITMCKFSHSRRVIGKNPSLRRKLTENDISNGMERFIEMKNLNKQNNYFTNMYI